MWDTPAGRNRNARRRRARRARAPAACRAARNARERRAAFGDCRRRSRVGARDTGVENALWIERIPDAPFQPRVLPTLRRFLRRESAARWKHLYRERSHSAREAPAEHVGIAVRRNPDDTTQGI